MWEQRQGLRCCLGMVMPKDAQAFGFQRGHAKNASRPSRNPGSSCCAGQHCCPTNMSNSSRHSRGCLPIVPSGAMPCIGAFHHRCVGGWRRRSGEHNDAQCQEAWGGSHCSGVPCICMMPCADNLDRLDSLTTLAETAEAPGSVQPDTTKADDYEPLRLTVCDQDWLNDSLHVLHDGSKARSAYAARSGS